VPVRPGWPQTQHGYRPYASPCSRGQQRRHRLRMQGVMPPELLVAMGYRDFLEILMAA
jgi:hypothetical protein